MEHLFMRNLFDDKQIVNPMNPDEVFSCSDLTDDYKICRREKRMQTSTVGKKMNCTEYRQLGKSINVQSINQDYVLSHHSFLKAHFCNSFTNFLFLSFLQPTNASTWKKTNSSITSWSDITTKDAMQTFQRRKALSWPSLAGPTKECSD